MLDANAQIPADFELKGYFGNAWAVYRGGKSYDVEILFTKEAALTVTEGTWHHTQKVRKNKDGSVTLTFTVDGLNEIVRWVLGWGSRAKVIQPPELRDLVIQQLKETTESYES
jgi:predicted DNA-binding transcriptional regulator YafY